jgi:hypothetical protein
MPVQDNFTRKVFHEVGGITDRHVEIYNKDAYKSALRKWKQYWHWKRNRNPERAVLEEKYGYDTKHAMHLIRLLRVGREILLEGDVIVDRYHLDRGHLLNIRNGKFTYDEILEESQIIMDDIEHLKTHSTLPKKADRIAIEAMMIELYEDYWASLKYNLEKQGPNYRKLDVRWIMEMGGK